MTNRLPAALLALATALPAADRPNIVVMIADDLGPHLGCYGDPAQLSPRIDALAAEGALFRNAFVTASSCSPSRGSLMTGLYPHSSGAMHLHQPLPGGRRTIAAHLRPAGYYTAIAGKWHLGNEAAAQFEVYDTGKGSDRATGGWLPILRDRPKDRPFFLWYASTDGHRPWNPQRETPPERVTVPPYLPDTPTVREDLAFYYDQVARFDGHVGMVVDELKRQGIYEDTWIFVLSDNGFCFPRGKTACYDSGLQTPLVVRGPGIAAAGTAREGLVSAVDLLPTVLTLAGLPAAPEVQGVSFAPLFADPAAQVRERVFGEHNWHNYQACERSLRTRSHLLIWNGLPQFNASPPSDGVRSATYQEMISLYREGRLTPEQQACFLVPRPTLELYDVVADPHQLRNLATEQPDLAARLLADLERWRRETGDPEPVNVPADDCDRLTGRKGPAADPRPFAERVRDPAPPQPPAQGQP